MCVRVHYATFRKTPAVTFPGVSIARVEASQIREALAPIVPADWDGKTTVEFLQSRNYNWRQTEWAGWYFEYRARELAMAALGGDIGPRIRSVVFDYRRQFVWDFKVHTPARGATGRHWAILNDCVAVDGCIADYAGLGFLIACGEALFDQGEFAAWHRDFGGGPSAYSLRRVAEGRLRSRRRKAAVRIDRVDGFFLSHRDLLQKAQSEGWLGVFQQGRNSNDAARPTKYEVDVARIPDWARV